MCIACVFVGWCDGRLPTISSRPLRVRPPTIHFSEYTLHYTTHRPPSPITQLPHPLNTSSHHLLNITHIIELFKPPCPQVFTFSAQYKSFQVTGRRSEWESPQLALLQLEFCSLMNTNNIIRGEREFPFPVIPKNGGL